MKALRTLVGWLLMSVAIFTGSIIALVLWLAAMAYFLLSVGFTFAALIFGLSLWLGMITHPAHDRAEFLGIGADALVMWLIPIFIWVAATSLGRPNRTIRQPRGPLRLALQGRDEPFDPSRRHR